MNWCATPAVRREHLQRLHQLADRTVDTQLRVLRIRYVIIPINGINVDFIIARLPGQHQVLNDMFTASNDLSQLPSADSGHYGAFSAANAANPNIQFYPADSSQVTVANQHIIVLNTPNSPPSSYEDVPECSREYLRQGYVIEPGVVHVYITDLINDSNGTLLGIAQNIPSNACALAWGTVGSPTLAGGFERYGAGRVLVHELGHCFGLFHPYSGLPCSDIDTQLISELTPETPKQTQSNQDASVVALAESGAADNALCNRGRDYKIYCDNDLSALREGDTKEDNTPYSCVDLGQLCDSGGAATVPYEGFVSVMDNGDDTNALCFFESHTNIMQLVLDQTFLNLQTHLQAPQPHSPSPY